MKMSMLTGLALATGLSNAVAIDRGGNSQGRGDSQGQGNSQGQVDVQGSNSSQDARNSQARAGSQVQLASQTPASPQDPSPYQTQSKASEPTATAVGYAFLSRSANALPVGQSATAQNYLGLNPTASNASPAVSSPAPALAASYAAVPTTLQTSVTPSASSAESSTGSSQYANSGKRGVAYNDPKTVSALRNAGSHISWGWNWYSCVNPFYSSPSSTRSNAPASRTAYGQSCNNNAYQSNSMAGLNYVPSIWSASDTCLASVFNANVQSSISSFSTNTIFAFNEPDMPLSVGGTATSVSDAVPAYKRLVQPWAGKVSLGAPGTTYTGPGSQGGWSWIRSFMQQCQGCTIDFIPIHFYISTWGDVNAAVKLIMDELTWLHANTGKPIWVTEMAYKGAPLSEEVAFVRAIFDRFETTDWLQRYLYRTGEELTGSDGKATKLGECVACYRTGGTGETCCEEV